MDREIGAVFGEWAYTGSGEGRLTKKEW